LAFFDLRPAAEIFEIYLGTDADLGGAEGERAIVAGARLGVRPLFGNFEAEADVADGGDVAGGDERAEAGRFSQFELPAFADIGFDLREGFDLDEDFALAVGVPRSW